MQIKYKGLSIITGAECDANSDIWNGRFRVLNDKDIVVYESFTQSCLNQIEASNAAKQAAYKWIDGQKL
ncbi:hypothetical protein [Nitrosomonas oligotropha]|uniref:hypothetical protein n=1 Tax=Nitrosomonas oligotropha TaxID=42354 RepID=UPI00137222B8|nr:hypothetical protein [Nitrosomonas oligotropha]MXS82733.1 hypothetical protein [Nitrosomonas oligotropha]